MNTKYAEYKQLNLTQISDEILSKWQSEFTLCNLAKIILRVVKTNTYLDPLQ